MIGIFECQEVAVCVYGIVENCLRSVFISRHVVCASGDEKHWDTYTLEPLRIPKSGVHAPWGD